MAGFVGLASRLIDEARAALNRGPGAILHKPERELDDEVPFEAARYVLTFAPLLGTSPIRALRAILKNALRAHGMRCVDIYQLPDCRQESAGKPCIAPYSAPDPRGRPLVRLSERAACFDASVTSPVCGTGLSRAEGARGVLDNRN